MKKTSQQGCGVGNIVVAKKGNRMVEGIGDMNAERGVVM